MVMFSCNRCSKGLKKKDVLNHSFQCGGRNNINVTCIDCLKDFRGNDYDSHTSCVTEEVRYGGKGVVAKEAGKKQNQWLGIVRQVLTVNKSLDHPIRKFLQSIQHLENIPRHKKKFHNWACSAMHIKDTGFLDKVFEVLQSEFAKSNEANKSKDNPKNQQEGELNAKANKHKKQVESVEEVHTGENGVNGVDKKKKKNKRDSVDDGPEGLENGSNGQSLEDKEEECKKPKMKRKNSHPVEREEPLENAEPMDQDGGTAEPTEDSAKLSKKERKMKKKKAKFEAELQEIENFKKEEDAGDGVVEVEPSKTKKSKKRKLVDESKVDKPGKDVTDEKHNKKQKVDDDRVNGNGALHGEQFFSYQSEAKKKELVKNCVKNCEVTVQFSIAASDWSEKKCSLTRRSPVLESSTELAAASSPKKQKFDWHQMIVDVVKKSKDGEVSVKKVTKKVINEYISMYGDKGIHEKLHAKMTKKLNTCPGTRVLKDKVRLLETEE